MPNHRCRRLDKNLRYVHLYQDGLRLCHYHLIAVSHMNLSCVRLYQDHLGLCHNHLIAVPHYVGPM